MLSEQSSWRRHDGAQGRLGQAGLRWMGGQARADTVLNEDEGCGVEAPISHQSPGLSAARVRIGPLSMKNEPSCDRGEERVFSAA